MFDRGLGRKKAKKAAEEKAKAEQLAKQTAENDTAPLADFRETAFGGAHPESDRPVAESATQDQKTSTNQSISSARTVPSGIRMPLRPTAPGQAPNFGASSGTSSADEMTRMPRPNGQAISGSQTVANQASFARAQPTAKPTPSRGNGPMMSTNSTQAVAPRAAHVPTPPQPENPRSVPESLSTRENSMDPNPYANHTNPTPQQPQGSQRATSFASHENGRLIVGKDIELTGTIKNCDSLIIEGTVEATLIDTRALEVTEFGVFRGTAPVDTAEITGLVEGDLIVQGHVFIRSTGVINGNVEFGEVEIERGGRVHGTMSQFGTEKPKKKAKS